jgi:AmmeMemoRadiSam system protein B
MNTKDFDIRPSSIAGTWYSANPLKLKSTIEKYIQQAFTPDLKDDIIGLIVPHAGHIYSGLTAAHAFTTIKNSNFQRVIVISPSHHYYYHPILTSGHQAYETPLGIIDIDREFVKKINEKLRDLFGISLTHIRNDQEHSLEIELPFLQCVLPSKFLLIPIMLRDQSIKIANALAVVIAEIIQKEKVLLVASTDLSHFYPEHVANQLDGAVLEAIKNFDIKNLYALNDSGKGQACGLGGVATILETSRMIGADKVQVLDYRTSANITHDSSSVVGYASAVITRSHDPVR